MRLLSTRTAIPKLHSFSGKPPRYAILSHTWGANELTFDQIACPGIEKELSFQKVKHACARARADNLDYIWIDSCCINKDSSAELSEAINSMFKWYEGAEVCYAFLEDVPRIRVDTDGFLSASEDSLFARGVFKTSRWFSRGWTLQELLAPNKVIFFSAAWDALGSKRELSALVSEVTRIPEQVLHNGREVFNMSVARRMSWAASRETTRVEDMAYCLMGLFEVNMPMLYGEGNKAFRRLQEEIMKISNDQTIFAWQNEKAARFSGIGMLARHPSCFLTTGDFVDMSGHFVIPPHTVTNKGVSLTCFLKGDSDYSKTAILLCAENGDPRRFAAVSLTRGFQSMDKIGSPEFRRREMHNLERQRLSGVQTTLFVYQESSPHSSRLKLPYFAVDLVCEIPGIEATVFTPALGLFRDAKKPRRRADGLRTDTMRHVNFNQKNPGPPVLSEGIYSLTDPSDFEYVWPLTPGDEALVMEVEVPSQDSGPSCLVYIRVYVDKYGHFVAQFAEHPNRVLVGDPGFFEEEEPDYEWLGRGEQFSLKTSSEEWHLYGQSHNVRPDLWYTIRIELLTNRGVKQSDAEVDMS